MIKDNKKIRFRLLGKEKSSVSFQLPLKKLVLPKTKDGPLKKVRYVPFHDSIFEEDQKGDVKSSDIWFQDGVLDVHPQNHSLLLILRKHPWNEIKYEEVSEDKEAQRELDKFNLIEKALRKIDIANEDERRATAIVLLGNGYFSKKDKTIIAGLKKMAMENPDMVLDKMNSESFTGQLAAALALIRGVVELNTTRTSVIWSDTRKPIINVALGQDAHEKFGEYLSGTSEDVKITLQEIGQKIKRGYTPKAELDMQKIFHIENGKYEIEPEAKMTIEQARDKYNEIFGSEVPVNKKNDIGWITEKIAESLETA